MTDILSRIRAGDESAFDALFRTWYPALVRLAERMLRDPEAAEEIVQDVLLEFWRRRETLDVHTSVQAYLFQSTRNRSLNRLRHNRVERRDEFDTDTLPSRVLSDTAAVEHEMEIALRDAIASLPPRCRQVFELNRIQGLKYAEVADVLGVSIKAVEAQMGRALRTLRERMAPWLPSSGGAGSDGSG
ncbi:MAG: RNA polymerase sigma-70 factor [Gemmatimonadota bacterium]